VTQLYSNIEPLPEHVFILHLFAGTDISGEVVGVGPGVANFIPGDKIISWINLLVCNFRAQPHQVECSNNVKYPSAKLNISHFQG
jgi:NADPH:quinone reductase-like Zn-dependent oxidoreductase